MDEISSLVNTVVRYWFMVSHMLTGSLTVCPEESTRGPTRTLLLLLLLA